MVQNYQAAYLACQATKNPLKIAEHMTSADFASYKLQLALDPSPDEFPSADDLYRAASERLRSFLTVGITERLTESLALVARKLGVDVPPPFDRRNVGGNRPHSVANTTRRKILDCTEVDHAIYADMRKRFEQEFKNLIPGTAS
jgi:hypothetical protein